MMVVVTGLSTTGAVEELTTAVEVAVTWVLLVTVVVTGLSTTGAVEELTTAVDVAVTWVLLVTVVVTGLSTTGAVEELTTAVDVAVTWVLLVTVVVAPALSVEDPVEELVAALDLTVEVDRVVLARDVPLEGTEAVEAVEAVFWVEALLVADLSITMGPLACRHSFAAPLQSCNWVTDLSVFSVMATLLTMLL